MYSTATTGWLRVGDNKGGGSHTDGTHTMPPNEPRYPDLGTRFPMAPTILHDRTCPTVAVEHCWALRCVVAGSYDPAVWRPFATTTRGCSTPKAHIDSTEHRLRDWKRTAPLGKMESISYPFPFIGERVSEHNIQMTLFRVCDLLCQRTHRWLVKLEPLQWLPGKIDGQEIIRIRNATRSVAGAAAVWWELGNVLSGMFD